MWVLDSTLGEVAAAAVAFVAIVVLRQYQSVSVCASVWVFGFWVGPRIHDQAT